MAYRLEFYFVLLLLLSACGPKPQPSPTFADEFPLAAADTLVFAVQEPREDTLSPAAFFAQVPDSLLRDINHILETGEPLISHKRRFPLDENHDGLAVNINVFWFISQCILVWHKPTGTVTGLFPAAEFYGGDGGQIRRQSWLLNTPGDRELIVRESQHTLRLDESGDDAIDVYDESVSRYRWQNGAFRQAAVADSAALIRRYGVEW